MTRRARIRKLMKKHSIEKIVYCGPLMLMGSNEWSRHCIDCDFYFKDDDFAPDSSRAFVPGPLKNDLRTIEKLAYYIFDFKYGEIKW